MSNALLGRPLVLPSSTSRAHIKPAFSSNERTRPANRELVPQVRRTNRQCLTVSTFWLSEDAATDFSDWQQGIPILPTRYYMALSRRRGFRARTRRCDRDATETYNGRKASCGRRRGPRTSCARVIEARSTPCQSGPAAGPPGRAGFCSSRNRWSHPRPPSGVLPHEDVLSARDSTDNQRDASIRAEKQGWPTP